MEPALVAADACEAVVGGRFAETGDRVANGNGNGNGNGHGHANGNGGKRVAMDDPRIVDDAIARNNPLDPIAIISQRLLSLPEA